MWFNILISQPCSENEKLLLKTVWNILEAKREESKLIEISR